MGLGLTLTTDAGLGGDVNERKSTFGYTFLLNNGVVSRRSKKRTSVALSTMEAEYIAMSIVVQEAVWLKRLLNHLGLIASQDPLTIYSDSQASIAYTKDPKFHGRTRHIEIKYHFVRDLVARGEVNLEHIPTQEMITDPFTKPLARDDFMRHVVSLVLRRM